MWSGLWRRAKRPVLLGVALSLLLLSSLVRSERVSTPTETGPAREVAGVGAAGRVTPGSETPANDVKGPSTLPPDSRALPIERLAVRGRSIDVVAGELVVRFASSVPLPTRDRILTRFGVTVLAEEPESGYLRLRLPAGATVAAFQRRFAALPEVSVAQPNVIARATANQCNLSGQYYSYQWHLARMKQADTCGISSANPSGVVVAVLDSGLAYENYNGYIRASDLGSTAIVHPWDFINNDAHPNDDQQHGTHIALTIAGMGKGSGVVPGVTLMPVKVLDNTNRGDEFSLAQGIRWAANHGAHVINLSLAFPAEYIPGGLLQEAVRYAADRGVLLIAASGNDGLSTLPYPAAFREVLSVGAARMKRLSNGQIEDELAAYSNRGPGLDLVAYGGDNRYDSDVNMYPDGILAQTIRAQQPGQTAYFFMSGTSQAAAVASGVTAWLLAMGATPGEARDTLLQTAVDAGSAGYDTSFGQGRIDLYKAVNFFRTNRPAPTPARYVNLFPVVYRDGGQEWGVARVRVLDDAGAPVPNAKVLAEWSGSVPLTPVSGLTDAAGFALLSSPAVTDDADGAIFAIQVSAVVGPDGRGVAPVDAYYVSEGMTRLLRGALRQAATKGTVLGFAIDPGDTAFAGIFDTAKLSACLVVRAIGPTLGTPGSAMTFTPDYLPQLSTVQPQALDIPLDGEQGFGDGSSSHETVTVYNLGEGLMTSGLVRANAGGEGLMTSGLSRLSGGVGLMTSGLSSMAADPAQISGTAVSGPVDVVFSESPEGFLADNPAIDPDLALALDETRFGANTEDSSSMAGVVYETSSQQDGEQTLEADMAVSFSILEFNFLLTLLSYIIFG